MTMQVRADFDPPSHVVREAAARALAEDLGPVGDVTTALIPNEAVAVAEIMPRADGVLAGCACFSETYRQVDERVSVKWSAYDGDDVVDGKAVGRVHGPLRSILIGERTALNFLCHLSGVATLTRAFVERAAPARVWDTRKTLPGLRALEKAAVRAGGGVNHRSSLSDMVLVKDNHIRWMSIADAVAKAHALWPGRAVEVECDDRAQVEQALMAGADLLMLDNMSPTEVAACVALVRSARPGTLVEVSGGVTLNTVAEYAAAGADLISTSAITQSAPALDLGLDLVTA
jgi:nicotinate-nucleotide pyrophosphorylase (carboxylating)